MFLGLDYGAKRIGLAVASGEARLARPLCTVPNDEQFLARLKNIIAEEAVTAIVLGWPRGLEGQETAQTREVKRFADEVLSPLGLPIIYQDEALTSEAAAGASDIDAEAARLILQDYLDTL